MITEEQFTEAMMKAVEERGESFVYPEEWRDEDADDGGPGSCQYRLQDGTPACIIGLAMHHAGLDLPEYGDNIGADALLEGLVPDHVRYAASHAQSAQDSYLAWGIAIEDYFSGLDQYKPQ